MEKKTSWKYSLKNKPHIVFLQDILSKEEEKVFLKSLKKNFPKVYDAWLENTKANIEEWFSGLEEQLKAIKGQLEDILDSKPMKEAEKMFGSYVRARWEGQLAIVLGMLEGFENKEETVQKQ